MHFAALNLTTKGTTLVTISYTHMGNEADRVWQHVNSPRHPRH